MHKNAHSCMHTYMHMCAHYMHAYIHIQVRMFMCMLKHNDIVKYNIWLYLSDCTEAHGDAGVFIRYTLYCKVWLLSAYAYKIQKAASFIILLFVSCMHLMDFLH